MARVRSRTSGSAGKGKGRLDAGRRFLADAQDLFALSTSNDGRSVISLCVNAVIAFGDALTLDRLDAKNSGDHAGLLKLLRRALGDQFSRQAERHLGALLSLNRMRPTATGS